MNLTNPGEKSNSNYIIIATDIIRLGYCSMPVRAPGEVYKRKMASGLRSVIAKGKEPAVKFAHIPEVDTVKGLGEMRGWGRSHSERVGAAWLLRPVRGSEAPLLVAVDVDDLSELDWVIGTFGDTPLKQISGREGGGIHLFYRWPDGVEEMTGSKTHIGGHKVDLKAGRNGYVVAPGSPHAITGKPYQLTWHDVPTKVSDLNPNLLGGVPIFNVAALEEVIALGGCGVAKVFGFHDFTFHEGDGHLRKGLGETKNGTPRVQGSPKAIVPIGQWAGRSLEEVAETEGDGWVDLACPFRREIGDGRLTHKSEDGTKARLFLKDGVARSCHCVVCGVTYVLSPPEPEAGGSIDLDEEVPVAGAVGASRMTEKDASTYAKQVGDGILAKIVRLDDAVEGVMLGASAEINVDGLLDAEGEGSVPFVITKKEEKERKVLSLITKGTTPRRTPCNKGPVVRRARDQFSIAVIKVPCRNRGCEICGPLLWQAERAALSTVAMLTAGDRSYRGLLASWSPSEANKKALKRWGGSWLGYLVAPDRINGLLWWDDTPPPETLLARMTPQAPDFGDDDLTGDDLATFAEGLAGNTPPAKDAFHKGARFVRGRRDLAKQVNAERGRLTFGDPTPQEIVEARRHRTLVNYQTRKEFEADLADVSGHEDPLVASKKDGKTMYHYQEIGPNAGDALVAGIEDGVFETIHHRKKIDFSELEPLENLLD